MDFYTERFEEHNIAERVQEYYPPEHLQDFAAAILAYVKYEQEEISYFIDEKDMVNPREKLHLWEIRKLLQIPITLLVFAIVAFLCSFLYLLMEKNYGKIGMGFLFGGMLALLVAILFWYIFVHNFFGFIHWLHNDYMQQWPAYAEYDYARLYNTFPDVVLADLAKECLVVGLMAAVGFMVLSFFLWERKSV